MPLILFAFMGGLGSGWWATTETVEATTGSGGKGNTLLLLILLVGAWYGWKKGWFK